MGRVAAIVLTYNEEAFIGGCLASLGWCHEVWVVDSFSTDETLEVCKGYPARVVQHPFEGFSEQRQWALDNLPIESDWVFFVDADERVPLALANEITARIEEDRFDGYYVPLHQYFWGKLVRHGDYANVYVLRLHRRGRGHFPAKEVHELLEVDGRLDKLKEPMVHEARHDVAELIAKLNRYSDLEALRMLRTGQELYTTKSRSYSKKNMLLKAVFERLPFKPLFKFLYEYFLCGGFLDGKTGFALALTQALYVYLAYYKLWEMKRRLADPPTES